MRRISVQAVAFALAASLTLAGCARTAPIHNIQDSQVAPNSGKTLAASQVRGAIITAGTSLGWKIADAGPGRLEGTLQLRTHTAVVEIPYDSKSFSITFKSAEHLNAANGTIHSNYNGWVENLDRAIRTEISRL